MRGAGDTPLDEPNARKIVEFILSRPHIGLIDSHHTTSGVHLRPFAARPDADVPPQDLQDFQAILSLGQAITSYPQASVYHPFTTLVPGVDPDAQPGARREVFIDWAYSHFGAFAGITEPWTMEPFVNEVGWGDIPGTSPPSPFRVDATVPTPWLGSWSGWIGTGETRPWPERGTGTGSLSSTPAWAGWRSGVSPATGSGILLPAPTSGRLPWTRPGSRCCGV